MQTLTRNTMRRERPISGDHHSILAESAGKAASPRFSLIGAARVTMRNGGKFVEGRAVVNGGRIEAYIEEECGA